MGRIAQMFESRSGRSGGALMPFITADYPRHGCTGDLLLTLQDAGAHAIEIGIPFSDPIADGPVIAASMHQALLDGSTPSTAFESIAQARPSLQIPLIAMVSVSIVTRLGGPEFVHRASESGIDGLIVPDADLDAMQDIAQSASEHDLGFSTLIAPDTSPSRMQLITQSAREFIYLLARRGLTGEREEAPDLAPQVTAVRSISELPIAAGFGISTPMHVEAVLKHADGAIVGSRLVRALTESANGDFLNAATELVRPLAQAANETKAN